MTTPTTRTVEIPVGSMIKVDLGDEPGEESVVLGMKTRRAYQLINGRWRKVGESVKLFEVSGKAWGHLVVDEGGVTVLHSVARVIDVECWETGKGSTDG